jgi:hypothetical protein
MTGIIQGLLASIGSAVASAASDAYFNLVTLLLNTTATNGAQNNTFLDSSTNNFSITRNGNTTQGTFTPFSQTGWGNYFDGTAGQYLNTPSNAAFAFGTGDFTVEAWVFVTGTNYCEIFITTNTTPTSTSMRFIVRNDQKLEYSDQTNTATSTGTIPLNTWTNVAVSRSGTSVKLFINGTQDGSTTSSNNLTNQVGYIGRTWDGFIFTGYISNLRVTKGGALYTSTFTPSTTPLTTTVSSGTVSLLTCQSNRFLDNSTNAFALTINGTPSVQAFSPFLPTTAYDAAVVGGSGYFDGTGDFLQLADSTAWDLTGDYTIEMWLYSTATPVSTTFFQLGSSSNFLAIYLASATKYITASGSLSITASTALALNSWNHMALVRSGSGTNNTVLYLNGVNVGQATNTTSFTGSASNGVRIGAEFPSDYYFNGYIAGNRIVNGTAVYTAAFTPPTAPPTAITNTSLLANYTNSGIFDSAAKNDLETVGNAQASTTQAKWGTTSMYFDGTGDYLVSNTATPDLYAFGSGNFTIEFWAYLNTVSGSQIFYDSRPSGTQTTQPTIFMSSAVLSYYTNNSTVITGSTLSTGQWYHIAVSRSGTSTKMFVNGTQVGSTYTDSTVYTNTSGRPLIGADSFAVGTNPLNGYIDDLRVTKGYARYTANFTAPTAAFPLN